MTLTNDVTAREVDVDQGVHTSKGHAHVDDQLCFALYSASRAVTAAYRAGLAELGLTYPQYVTMLAVWEDDGRTVGALGRALSLDSGTLSPILRRLVEAGFVRKQRDDTDERTVRVYTTQAGADLEKQVAAVRESVEASTGLSRTQLRELRSTLHTLRATIEHATGIETAGGSS